MAHHFWRLEHLSDRQLLEGLQGVLRTQRCALAELIAHLAEVEERRLHLAAAHGSMFSYCVGQLGMSEDEACRRIELARLARRFPLLFGELASGRISLSVALLLKPVLTPENHAELIAAAGGASSRTAREMLAARFPSPDVPSRIRKLPERLVANPIPTAVAVLASAIPTPVAVTANATPAPVTDVANAVLAPVAVTTKAIPAPVCGVVPANVTTPGGTHGAGATAAFGLTSPPQPYPSLELDLGLVAGVCGRSSRQEPPTPAERSHAPALTGLARYADPRQRIKQRIEPLSAERYRIQFTADAALKRKLELARDLLRHSNPGGDLAPIVSRALELLLQELLQRRFGARRKDASQRSARPRPHAAPVAPAAALIETPQASTPPVAVPAPARTVTPPSVAAPATLTAPTPLPLAVPALARTVTSPSVTALLATSPPAMSPPAASPPATPPCATPPATSPPVTPPCATPPSATPPVPPPAATPASQIPRAARRAVLERDGLGCCWADATGKRCGTIAWLELDHDHPSGKGGSSEPDNLRLLCRAHNRFAAERAYGRDHVERAIQARRQSAKRRSQNEPSPSSSPAP